MSEEDYIAMIYDSMSGSLSNENQLLLNKWINASVKNQSTFDEIKRIHYLEESYRDQTDYNTLYALNKVKAKRPGNKVKTIQNSLWWSAAAVLVCIFGGWYLINSMSSSQSFEAGNSIRHYQLDDGSEIWLLPGSTFSFNTKDDNKRFASLQGSAYFDIYKDPVNPFHIQTDNFSIVVLGTEFTVNTSNKNQPQLIVKEGKVRLATQKDTAVLIANQRATISENNKITHQIVSYQNNIQSWRTNRLMFRDTPLEHVVDDLQRHYNILINIGSPKPKSCEITAIFVNEKLEEVLEHIYTTTGLESEKTIDGWEISGPSCE